MRVESEWNCCQAIHAFHYTKVFNYPSGFVAIHSKLGGMHNGLGHLFLVVFEWITYVVETNLEV